MNIAALPVLLTAGGMVVNAVWSVLNLKMLATLKEQIRQEFVSRAEYAGDGKLRDERHGEVCRRLEVLETRPKAA